MRRFMRIGSKMLLTLVILGLLTGPLWAILYISRLEQAFYTPQEVVQLQEFSYGPLELVVKRDMYETVQLSGRVISAKYLYQELDLADPGRFRQEVKIGQVIQAGDVLGYCKGEPVLAEQTGVLSAISLGSEAYMRLESLEELVVECYVNEQQLTILKRSNLDLQDSNGGTYTVARVDPVASAQGTRVLLRFQGGELAYGDSIDAMQLTTGRKFAGALVVPEDCVYQLKDGKYYVRMTDVRGVFISEIEVIKSYSDGEYVCVSGRGLNEGMYCDSGYKLVVESGGGDAGT